MDISKLELWYKKNHRKLPFRDTKDPYIIWISEIMLQQTQVETVLPFFEKFTLKYPNISTLAQVNKETLQKDVEGLGYYRRFRNMHLAARKIESELDGLFPATYDGLLALPGIGKYTAGAIMSIAYHKPYSALDGNVIRVLSRYLGIDDDMRQEKNKKKLDIINQSYIEKANPNIYTQAMMELGATICKPKNPKCDLCPLQNHCSAFENNNIEKLPYLTKLKDKKTFQFITLIIHTQNGLYMRKRTEELLKGMYEYPQFEAESYNTVQDDLEDQGVLIDLLDRNHTLYKHVFTHQIWLMEVYHVRIIKGHLDDWVEMNQESVPKIPMAIAHRKIKAA